MMADIIEREWFTDYENYKQVIKRDQQKTMRKNYPSWSPEKQLH